MRHAIIPALFLLFLSGCSEKQAPGRCGTGAVGNPALRVVTAQMPNAIQSGYYYAQIRATGGAGPFTWTLNGTLPPGLSLTQSTGQVAVIQGVPPNYTWQWLGGAAPPPPPPNTDDPLPFDVQITDSALNTTTRHFLIEVDPAAASTVTTRGITDTTVGCEFSARFNAVGGVAGAYAWAITSGTLPPGLTLASSSVAETELAGVPTTAGAYSFDIQASDTMGVVGTASCSLTVFGAGESLRIEPLGATTTFNFNLWPTNAFLSELRAVGGTGGYTWQIISGAMPAGLSLNQDGQQHASIAGTITVQGTFSWQIEVRDQNGNTFTSAITMNIVDQPPP
jgi:large repetitive protein